MATLKADLDRGAVPLLVDVRTTGEYAGGDYHLDVTAIVADDDTASATATAEWGGISAATEGWTSADAAQRWAVGQVAGWVKDAVRGRG